MTEHYSCDLKKVKRLEPELTGDNLLWFNPSVMKPSVRSILAIGDRLKRTREALQLTQAELCRRAGIAPNTYNQWEPKKDGSPPTGRPELDYAIKLCEALGYTLDWIYRGNPVGLPYQITAKLDLSAPAEPIAMKRRAS